MRQSRTSSLSADEITAIAAEVSAMMQLSRISSDLGRGVDPATEANVPDYIASVFEAAGAISPPLSNDALYEAVNKRISQLQAQLYMMRIEMENQTERDPAALFDDPRAIATYGAHLDGLTQLEKSFGFEPALLAHGWHPTENNGKGWHRWMRPVDMAIVCLPHLGLIDQTVDIIGQVLDPVQLGDLQIGLGHHIAKILPDPETSTRFTARLSLKADQVPSASLLPLEVRMTEFRKPDTQDPRLLGVNVSRFICRPGVATQTKTITPDPV
ncbi:MAG: hypothetical protein AAGE38_00255 [Pseudomonadota bacterium]